MARSANKKDSTGRKRTRRGWQLLIEKAGLRLIKISQTAHVAPLVVVECILKECREGDGSWKWVVSSRERR
jgi:hypothetical protein